MDGFEKDFVESRKNKLNNISWPDLKSLFDDNYYNRHSLLISISIYFTEYEHMKIMSDVIRRNVISLPGTMYETSYNDKHQISFYIGGILRYTNDFLDLINRCDMEYKINSIFIKGENVLHRSSNSKVPF